MTTKQMRENRKWFFGYMMQMLGQRGYSRSKKKAMIRSSKLIEKCLDADGIEYVLHYNVDDWVDYIINGNKWPRTQEEREWYAAWGGKTPTAKNNLLIFEQEHKNKIAIGA